MTDQTSAPAAEAAPVVSAPNLDSGVSLTAEQAFEAYQNKRNSPVESAEPATAGKESAVEADAAPEKATSEVAEVAEPEETLPPIERPRSWTKDVDDLWQTLPREMQEKVASREQDRDKELRRSQNEAADIRKAAEAAQKLADEARKKYEDKLPALERKLQTVGPFADVQTMDDLKRMQAEDPFRFQQYQVYIWEQQAEQQELRDAEARKTQERQSKRSGYEAEQNKLLMELVPEMADPEKASDLRNRAIAMLTDDLGLKNDQLSRWMQDDTGHEILSNAGIQKLIADGLKFREIRAAPPKAIPKPVPTVQKPGVGRAPGAASADAIQATRNKLNSSGSAEDAYALYQAKKARAR